MRKRKISPIRARQNDDEIDPLERVTFHKKSVAVIENPHHGQDGWIGDKHVIYDRSQSMWLAADDYRLAKRMNELRKRQEKQVPLERLTNTYPIRYRSY